MSIIQYKPVTAGRRFASVNKTHNLTSKRPEKRLCGIAKRRGGRSHGTITVRHRGGGEKRFVRIVDFYRDKFEVPAAVTALEYDPNRGARLMLLQYTDGEKRYSIAPHDVSVGDQVISSRKPVELKPGNRTTFEHIPVGVEVHDIELQPGQGSKMARGAGCACQFRALEGQYALLKMPSGEIRKVFARCMATIGRASNVDHNLVRFGKAGRTRHRGIRPAVRGKAMNPVDHPHGGGEGRNSIGLPYPKTPWGKHALGVRTRDPKKWSNSLILRRRYESLR